MKVPKRWRNHGDSYGLEYPYLVGLLAPALAVLPQRTTSRADYQGIWSVWHRHTGLVVFQSRERNYWVAEAEARRECQRLNGILGAPVDTAALDTTP